MPLLDEFRLLRRIYDCEFDPADELSVLCEHIDAPAPFLKRRFLRIPAESLVLPAVDRELQRALGHPIAHGRVVVLPLMQDNRRES